MNQTELSFTGLFRRDLGMKRVASRTDSGWRLEFDIAAERWLNRLGAGARFAGESIRLSALESGVGEPHHSNAWSSCIRTKILEWIRDGRIELAGATTCVDPKAHARLTRCYSKVSA